MNKFSVLFLALIAVFYSCSNPNEFSIKGKLKNANNQSISLEEIGETQYIPFDSTKVDGEGNFTFEGKIKEPKFFILKVGNNLVTLYVEPGDKITFDADLNSMSKEYKVEGSKGSTEIKNFNDFLYANLEKLQLLGVTYQSAVAENTLDSVQPLIDKELEGLIASQKKYTSDLIDRNLGSIITIFIIHQQFPPQQPIFNLENDMEVYEKVLGSLKKTHPENMYVKSFDSFLTKVKQQLEMQASKALSTQAGVDAMEIVLPTPKGDTIRLSSLKGKYVLLDFWAAWCRPCRAENPNLVANYAKYGGKNFEIFQVSLDQTKDAWVGAIEKDQLGKWIHVSDLQYWNSAAAQLYGVQSIPANYLIDPQGKIIAQNLRGPALGQKLSEIFGK